MEVSTTPLETVSEQQREAQVSQSRKHQQQATFDIELQLDRELILRSPVDNVDVRA